MLKTSSYKKKKIGGDNIETLMIELYISVTCEYCKRLKKTKSYQDLVSNYDKYFDIPEVLYIERECNRQGLFEKRFPDKIVENSKFELLGLDMDEETDNYLAIVGRTEGFPMIKLTWCTKKGNYDSTTINGILIKHENELHIHLMDYLQAYLAGYVPEHMRQTFTHEIVKYKERAGDPILSEDKKLVFNEKGKKKE